MRTRILMRLVMLALAMDVTAARAENLVSNPDFDMDASDWSSPGVFDSTLDAAGDPASGSLRLVAATPSSFAKSLQRFDLAGPTVLRAGGCIRMEPGQSGSGYSQIDLNFYAGSCASPGGFLLYQQVRLALSPSPSFSCGEADEFSSPSGDTCVEVSALVANAGETGSLGANFDSIFVPEPGATLGTIASVAMIAAIASRRAAGRAAAASQSS